MTVAELIAALQTLPKDAEVRMHDDELGDQPVVGIDTSEAFLYAVAPRRVVLHSWPVE